MPRVPCCTEPRFIPTPTLLLDMDHIVSELMGTISMQIDAKPKDHTLLLGASGVGKTALLKALLTKVRSNCSSRLFRSPPPRALTKYVPVSFSNANDPLQLIAPPVSARAIQP